MTERQTPESLVFTDVDGEPAQVQDLMDDGPDDYQDRIPALIALMDSGSPAHRLYAAMILTAWGNERGFQQIVAWAKRPEQTPWASEPITYDRFYGTDSSFADLADAVRTSFGNPPNPALEAHQLSAIEALLEVSSRRYVDTNLALAIAKNRRIEEQVAPKVAHAIESALARLASGERVGFDLGFQTASLISTLATIDDAAAGRYAGQLIDQFRTSERMLTELAAALGQGAGPATAAALERLRVLGGPAVEGEVAAALARRHRAAPS